LELYHPPLPVNWPEILRIFNDVIRPDSQIADLYREIIHWPKQIQHLGGPGTPGYVAKKSYLTVGPLQLVPSITGVKNAGDKERTPPFGYVIGKKVDPNSGAETNSDVGLVSFHSGLGIHIYPGNPSAALTTPPEEGPWWWPFE
jgi:hypothetical protein